MNYQQPKIIAKEIIDSEFSTKKVEISQREKNIAFMKKYHITKKEAIEIVHDLTINHFVKKIKTEDLNISADYLYVFKANVQLNDIYGNGLECVYIKICKIDEGILAVSFHEAE